jgi:hypothetical protein
MCRQYGQVKRARTLLPGKGRNVRTEVLVTLFGKVRLVRDP